MLVRRGTSADFELAHKRLSQLVLGTVGDLLNEPYEATREQRRAIRLMTSAFIGHFIKSTNYSRVHFIWQPSNEANRGFSKTSLRTSTSRARKKYLPKKFAYLFEGDVGPATKARLVADCISSLTEHETIALHEGLPKDPRAVRCLILSCAKYVTQSCKPATPCIRPSRPPLCGSHVL